MKAAVLKSPPHISDSLPAETDLIVISVFRKQVEVNIVSALGQQRLQILRAANVTHQQWSMCYIHLDQLTEGRPLLRIIVPAVKHHVVNFSDKDKID